MDSARKSALVVGVLFIVTFMTSIPPAFIFYTPVLNNTHYIISGGADTRVFAGAFLEVLLMIANIGTAVAIFPIVRRQNEALALGGVASRIVESAMIGVGIIALLSVVTMRRDFAGSSGGDAATLVIVGKALVAIHKWTFLLGPGICPGIENGLILGYLLYRSGLVPRPIAVLGLIGGPLALVAGTLELFQVFPQVSGATGILTLPEALFEAAIGIWLTVKGFRSTPITAAVNREARKYMASGPSAA